MRVPRWIKAGLAVTGAIIVTATVSGSILEQRARVRVTRDIVMPGRFVDVGDGRRMQLDCRGSGSPTVVLESGLDPLGSLSWVAVHDSIARTTRVCAYSRAGMMWSDPDAEDFDGRRAARDLHTALTASGEKAPWVMVGHSLGGSYAMIFTRLFDADVGGMVLVDASHPDQFGRYSDATGKDLKPSATVPRIGAALAWTGLVRMMSPMMPTSWPAAIGATVPRLLPTSVGALARETAAVATTLRQAGETRTLGDRPLIALSAALGPQPAEIAAMGLTPDEADRLAIASRALHDDQARWSRRGRNEVVAGASHYIQLDRPDAVIAAVREVVTSVRTAHSAR